MKKFKIFMMILALILVVSFICHLIDKPDVVIDDHRQDDSVSHDNTFVCASCGVRVNINECQNYNIEDYGSVGAMYYNIECPYCGVDSSTFEIYHSYDDDCTSNQCVMSGCGHKCNHLLTMDSILYFFPYNDYDFGDSKEGDYAKVGGYCAICGCLLSAED